MWTVGSGDGKSLRGWRLWEISIQMKSICIYFELKSSMVVFFLKFLTFLTSSLAYHHLWSDSLSSGLYAHPSPLSIVTITCISYTS